MRGEKKDFSCESSLYFVNILHLAPTFTLTNPQKGIKENIG